MIRLPPTMLFPILILLAGGSSGLHAQELGRLFLTPAERAYLERLRIIDNQLTPIVLEAAEPELDQPEAPPPEHEDVIYRHGGTMRRSDGSYTVWLNNVPVEQTELPANVELLTPYSRGELRINDPDNNRNYRVKPGQVLNLTQGILQESYLSRDVGTGEAESEETGSAISQGDQQ